MYKILKIDQQFCYVGNVEDKSMIKVLIENGYEGMSVGDQVDLFSDGELHFIAKKEKNVTFTNLVQELPKFKRPELNFEKISFESIKQIPWLDKFKQPATWLSAGIFVAVLFASSFILSFILNSQIEQAFSEAMGGFSSATDAIRLHPMVSMFLLIMGRFLLSMTSESMFGSIEIVASVYMPVILLSIPLYILSVSLMRRFIKLRVQNISEKDIFVDTTLSSILAITFISVVLMLLSMIYSGGALKVSYQIGSTFFRNVGLLLVINGLFYLLFSQNLSKMSMIWATLRHCLIKVVMLVIVGLFMGLYLVLFVYKEPITFFGLGNLALLYPVSAFGGQVLLDSNFGFASGTQLFGADQLSIIVFGLGIIVSNFLWFIDADEIHTKFDKVNPYLLSVAMGTFTSMVLWYLSSISSISFSLRAFSSRMTLMISSSFFNVLWVAIVLTGLSIIRYLVSDKVEKLNEVKESYRVFVEKVFGAKR